MCVRALQSLIAERTGRRYVRLVGRGTTALYVALRTLAIVHGPGSVILPDLICSAVLDAVLLAGFRPCFADVDPERFHMRGDSVQAVRRADTKAVLMAHPFGLIAPRPDVGLLVIEDAVQGIGGAAGKNGALSVVGFHPSKLIPGVGGAVLTDDPDLARAMHAVSLAENSPPYAGGRYAHYLPQLAARRPALIRPFEATPENCAAIRDGWDRLAHEVRARNARAERVRAALAERPDLGLHLPPIRASDAVWRYPITAPTRAVATTLQRRLQFAGLPGSRPYPALSAIFDPQPAFRSPDLAARMMNIWVDSSVGEATFAALIGVLCAPLTRGGGAAAGQH